jgi:hypothetical protein
VSSAFLGVGKIPLQPQGDLSLHGSPVLVLKCSVVLVPD